MDQFGIWYGIHKYKVKIQQDELNQKKEIPNSVSLGPHSGRIFYPGQIPRCLICSSQDHQVKDCEQMKCWRCGHLGHKAKECSNSSLCNLCGNTGHNFFSCPQSYSNKTKIQRKSQTEPQQHGQTESVSAEQTTVKTELQKHLQSPLCKETHLRSRPDQDHPETGERRGLKQK